MRTETYVERKIRRALQVAQATTMAFGVALLLWGLAPAVLMRLVTGKAPPLAAFAAGGVALALGVIYFVLGLLIGRRLGWAIWSTIVTVGLLTMVGLAVLFTGEASTYSVFPLLLGGATLGTCLMALETQRKAA